MFFGTTLGGTLVVMSVAVRAIRVSNWIARDPGDLLRQRRGDCNLTMRQVTAATKRMAEYLDNEEFVVSVSRLCEIETRGVVPGIYRMYSLAVVYNIELTEILLWYGIPNLPIPPQLVLPKRISPEPRSKQ